MSNIRTFSDQECRPFNYHQDAGHGWLEVPMNLLSLMTITGGKKLAHVISDHSYYSSSSPDEHTANLSTVTMVFLEEDCDMMRFMDWFAEHRDAYPRLIHVDDGNCSYIRRMPSYRELREADSE